MLLAGRAASSTVAMFRRPSILRNLICPLATRLRSSIAAPLPRSVTSLRLHAAAKLLVKSLNRVGGPERFQCALGNITN